MKKKVCISLFISAVVAAYMNVNLGQIGNVTDVVLANVEALAFEEELENDSECYTNIMRTSEVIRDKDGNEIKISDCEEHSCNSGKGDTCSSGSHCIYYAGPYAGQESGSIIVIYC
nr:hypothetical protein [uncultured Bacteroides sp.]